MINWDREGDLVAAIARRRSVLVIGSGVSRNSVNKHGERPESWEGFLRKCSLRLGKPSEVEKLIDRKDFLLACQIIKDRLEDFTSIVQSEYQLKGFNAAKIHQHLYDLDVSITLSPNFDNIYDDFCRTASSGTYVIKNYSSSDTISYIRGVNCRLLIKIHGAANDPDSVMFTAHDYSQARIKCRHFYEIIKSLAITHTFFSVGCGVDDPDIKILFEDIRFSYGRIPNHYMTIPYGEIDESIKRYLSESLHVKFLEYDSANGHVQLISSIESLVSHVEIKRDEIKSSRLW